MAALENEQYGHMAQRQINRKILLNNVNGPQALDDFGTLQGPTVSRTILLSKALPTTAFPETIFLHRFLCEIHNFTLV